MKDIRHNFKVVLEHNPEWGEYWYILKYRNREVDKFRPENTDNVPLEIVNEQLLRDVFQIDDLIDIHEWCIDNLLVKEIPDGMYLTCDSDGYYTLYIGTINVGGFSRVLDLESSSTVEIITNHFELSSNTDVEQWLLNNLEIKEVD